MKQKKSQWGNPALDAFMARQERAWEQSPEGKAARASAPKPRAKSPRGKQP